MDDLRDIDQNVELRVFVFDKPCIHQSLYIVLVYCEGFVPLKCLKFLLEIC